MEHYPKLIQIGTQYIETLYYEETTNVRDLEPLKSIDWKHGDIIHAPSRYFWFIDKDGNIINNPDFSNAGYISIPLEISSKFKDARKSYRNIGYEHLELSHNDKYIVNKIGKFDDGFSFVILDDEDIEVTFPDGKKNIFLFHKRLNKDLIMKWWEGSKLPQAKLKLTYYFDNTDKTKFYLKDAPDPFLIPATWNATALGSNGGSDKDYSWTLGAYGLYGPRNELPYILKNINRYYKNTWFYVESDTLNFRSLCGIYEKSIDDPFGRDEKNGLRYSMSMIENKYIKEKINKWLDIKDNYQAILIQKILRGYLLRKKISDIFIEKFKEFNVKECI